MSSDWAILQRDVAVFEAMIAELEAYLMSEATHWTLVEADMPGLTIGGILLRQQRLEMVIETLTPEARVRFEKGASRLSGLLRSNVVRFEVRAHQELHARISEWVNYLRRLQRGEPLSPDFYQRVADTRVVIAAIIVELQKSPYQLDLSVEQEVEILDRNLRRRWESGGFIWAAVWSAAYPEQVYWYLYGRLR